MWASQDSRRFPYSPLSVSKGTSLQNFSPVPLSLIKKVTLWVDLRDRNRRGCCERQRLARTGKWTRKPMVQGPVCYPLSYHHTRMRHRITLGFIFSPFDTRGYTYFLYNSAAIVLPLAMRYSSTPGNIIDFSSDLIGSLSQFSLVGAFLLLAVCHEISSYSMTIRK